MFVIDIGEIDCKSGGDLVWRVIYGRYIADYGCSGHGFTSTNLGGEVSGWQRVIALRFKHRVITYAAGRDKSRAKLFLLRSNACSSKGLQVLS